MNVATAASPPPPPIAAPPERPFTHGTSTGYIRHGCRCEDCREWRKLAKRAYRARRKAREAGREVVKQRKPRPFTHGTSYGHRERKCRCEACRGWKREKSRLTRERKASGAVEGPAAKPAARPLRQPLPDTAERRQLWAGIVARMTLERRLRLEAGGR